MKFKKITKASIKYEGPIYLRVGTDLVLEIRKEGDDYYLLDPAKVGGGKINDCENSLPLLNGAHVILGRQEMSSECLELPDSTSRQHMLIKREFDMIYLFDLHSKNGSYLKV